MKNLINLIITKMQNKKSNVAIIIIILIVVIASGILGWVFAKKSQKPVAQNQIIDQSEVIQQNQQQEIQSNVNLQKDEEVDVAQQYKIDTNAFHKCLEDDRCLYIKESNKIVKILLNDNSQALIISNSDGSNEQVLVERKFKEFDGKVMQIIGYSDNGKYVYYSPEQPDGLGGAYIFGGVYGGMNKVDTETKTAEKILTTENTGAIYNVSKDGKWVAYETYAGENIPYYYPKMNKKAVDFNGLILKDLKNVADRKISHRKDYIRFGNSIFSPDSTKIAYEEEKGEDPEFRQYDAIVENVNDGGQRVIFENCSLAASEWQKNKNSWIDDRYLLIHCRDEKYYRIDTISNKKEAIEPTEDMKKWNIF